MGFIIISKLHSILAEANLLSHNNKKLNLLLWSNFITEFTNGLRSVSLKYTLIDFEPMD